MVSVEVDGGIGFYFYFWSIGSSDDEINVRVVFLFGILDVYYLIVIDVEGCFFMDSVFVIMINSIDLVWVVVDNVIICSGNDGEILMVFLSGLSFFIYSWFGSLGISGLILGVVDILILMGFD